MRATCLASCLLLCAVAGAPFAARAGGAQLPDDAAPPAASAPADEDAAPAAEVYQRHLALGVSTVKELGFIAAQIRGRYDHVAFEAAFGLLPILIFITGDETGIIADYSLHATGSVLVFFNSDQSRMSHGLRAGAIWDGKFGWGGLVGWQGELRLTRLLSLSFGAGIQFYPQAGDWAGRRLEKEYPDASVNIDAQTYVQPYVGVGLLLYLL